MKRSLEEIANDIRYDLTSIAQEAMPSGLGAQVDGKNPSDGITHSRVVKQQIRSYSPNVKNMQEKIKILAKNVTDYGKSGNDTSQSGKKAFNDFMTQAFVGKKDIKGVEYSDDASETSIAAKKSRQSDLFEMHVIMNNLTRLGGSSKELSIDGKWGDRTENALRNIHAFASALLELDQKFTDKVPTEFSTGNLAYIEEAATLSEDDFTKSSNGEYLIKAKAFKGDTVSSVADGITNTIVSLLKYYQNFLKRTLQDPRNAIFIENNKPLDSVSTKKSDKKQLSDQEGVALEQESKFPTHKIKVSIDGNIKSPNVGKSVDIYISNLSDKESFNHLCDTLDIDLKYRKLFLRSLTKQISEEATMGTRS